MQSISKSISTRTVSWQQILPPIARGNRCSVAFKAPEFGENAEISVWLEFGTEGSTRRGSMHKTSACLRFKLEAIPVGGKFSATLEVAGEIRGVSGIDTAGDVRIIEATETFPASAFRGGVAAMKLEVSGLC